MRKWLGRHQETYQNGQTGKRRERGKKVNEGWSLKGNRKCRKSLSCRMRWKALSWTWMAKAVVRRWKQSSREEEEKYSTKVRRLKVQKESYSVGSEETQDYVREAKSTEYEEEEERTSSYWQLASVVERRRKHIRPTCVRSVSINNCCRQKEKGRCQTCSGDRWWKRRRIAEGCGK